MSKAKGKARSAKITTGDYERILLAFDGSANSRRAAEVAQDVAKAHGAELIVLKVVESPMYPYGGPGSTMFDLAPYAEAAKKDAEVQVQEVVDGQKDAGVNARGVVVVDEGSPVKSIVDFAEKEDVDLIVVGTRGMSNFKKLLLGSVSSGLVSHANCAVLVAR